VTETKGLETPEAVRRAGWIALVAALGPTDATRFVLMYESGHHDYAAMREDLFRGKTVDALYREMTQRKQP
jgi:hypothetical protein